jgi:hypothetical protein
MFANPVPENEKGPCHRDQSVDFGMTLQPSQGTVEGMYLESDRSVLQRWMKRFIAWALTEGNIRAAIALDSINQPLPSLEKAADLNLLILLTGAEDYLAAANWLQSLGQLPATWVELSEYGRAMPAYRLSCNAGIEVHFLFIPVIAAYQMIVDTGIPPEVARMLRSGRPVLFDKDGLLKAMIRLAFA